MAGQHNKKHVLMSAEVYALAGDKDKATEILKRYGKNLDDLDLINIATLVRCIIGERPEFDPSIELGVLTACAHLVPDYNPVKDFLRLDPNEAEYSMFIRNLVLRDKDTPGRKDLIEEAIKMLKRVKDKDELVMDKVYIAAALKKVGDERYRDYVKELEGVLRGKATMKGATAMLLYYAFLKDKEELDQFLNTLTASQTSGGKRSGKEEKVSLITLLLNAYDYTKEAKLLDLALKEYGEVKWGKDTSEKLSVLGVFIAVVDRPEVTLSFLRELTDIVEIDAINVLALAPILGIAYVNIKGDDRLIQYVFSKAEDQGTKLAFMPGFIENAACEQVRVRLVLPEPPCSLGPVL
ncbi:hypothetical protein [Stygiolobus caldivivus]|nr:hypothetical protein [Stygiolobus caldivivus]